MDITILLKEDHREVDGLIAELQDSATKETFLKLKTSLDLHAEIEETILYPALEENDETEDQVTDSYQEHDEVKQLLEEMAATDIKSEDFQDLLQQLKDSVDHHVEEEETELFPKAEKLLGVETLEAMGEEMDAMKSRTSSAANF